MNYVDKAHLLRGTGKFDAISAGGSDARFSASSAKLLACP